MLHMESAEWERIYVCAILSNDSVIMSELTGCYNDLCTPWITWCSCLLIPFPPPFTIIIVVLFGILKGYSLKWDTWCGSWTISYFYLYALE